MKLLQGANLRLRAVEPQDIDLLMQWENNTLHWEVSGTVAPFSRALLTDYIRNAHLDIYQTGQLRLMIERLKEGDTIGTVDLFDFDAFHQRAGVGILIGNPEAQNNGYASESLELMKEYCFLHLSLRQLFCNILEDNKASLHLFQKAGFQISGNKKAWVRSGNEFKDQYFLQVFSEKE